MGDVKRMRKRGKKLQAEGIPLSTNDRDHLLMGPWQPSKLGLPTYAQYCWDCSRQRRRQRKEYIGFTVQVFVGKLLKIIFKGNARNKVLKVITQRMHPSQILIALTKMALHPNAL
jgi:hypothetical protein